MRSHLYRNTLRTLLAALCLAAPCAKSGAQPTLHSTADWQSDLTFLVSTMKAVHPSPFHRVSEQDIDRAAASLKSDIPKLTDQQIALRVAAIVALLNDGHCSVQFAAPIFARDKSYPIRMEKFRDGIFIVASRPQDAGAANERVLTINGKPAATVWDSLMVIAPGDNDFSRMSNVPLYLTMPEVMAALGLARADTLVLGVSSGKRIAIPAVITTFNPRTLGNSWNGPGGAIAPEPAGQGSANVVERHRQSPYWFTVEGHLLYAQINQVNNSGDTVQLGASTGVVTIAQLAQRIVDRIDAGDIDKLVLDLRFNGGGDNSLARPFVQTLAANAKINQKGRLFVITGRETYSAAMNFTSMLEERTNAIFVGEAPGGAPSHYGDNTPFVLPASKLPFRISTLHWDIGVRPSDVREIMEPDLPAPPTFADHRAGIDAPMKAIIAYRDGDRLADRLLARSNAAGLDSAFALYARERAANTARDLWSSDEQELVEFAYAMLSRVKQRADIFRVFGFVTEQYPDSPDAWTTQARIHAFVNDTPEVLRAFRRARELRPQNDFIRRSYEAASRK